MMVDVVPPGSDVPAWFSRAIAAPFTEHVASVDDIPLHYVRWGRDAGGGRPKTPLVLIHGGGAHAFWWGFLAPLLADRYDVLALDLTGHGDSGRRDHYPREVWVNDILALVAHANLEARPFLVGHSMGGFVATVAAALHGERLSGAILVDSPIRPPHSVDPAAAPTERGRSGWTFERMSPYPDFEAAARRFRPLPDQPTPYPYLVDYVAERSLRKDPDGFTWKFDPKVFERASRSSLRDYFTAARCRLALVRGAESIVMPREVGDYMVGLGSGRVPLVEIPDGHHHLMFDQPLPLLVAVRALLAAWESSPH
jgi:pimeloyl-ACP methyl ester carboxylesterase